MIHSQSNCQKIPELLKSLLNNPLVCLLATENDRKPCKNLFHNNKVCLDPANFRKYCTDILEFCILINPISVHNLIFVLR